MYTLILIIPFLAALLFWTVRSKGLLHIINAAASGLLLLLSAMITRAVLTKGTISYSLWNGFFYIDSLSLIVLDIITAIGFFCCIYSIGYLDEEYRHQVIDLHRIKIFYSLTYAFIFTMLLVVTTQNLGLMWIAIEATTLASAFLVGFYNNRNSIEAAWKYIIICSVGIAFALLGIVFLHFSSVNTFKEASSFLNWLPLYQEAASLQGSILKISFIFVLIGFGTKVGLVPMHTWLPDAHSQAPAPISALLSGVLLNSAMYGIIRVLSIVNRNLGDSVYTGRLLMVFGLLSVAAAAIFIFPQKDYKRLLAYSSIEHMGIIAFGLGMFTPLSIFASMFHMVNHAFTKSMLFLASGNVYLKYKTREIAKVSGVLKALPLSGTAFLIGIFAIAGMPPFNVFSSEFGLILSAFDARHNFQAVLFVLMIALVFAGMAATLLRMFFGNAGNREVKAGEINLPGTAAILVLLVIISLTGIYMPYELKSTLEAASNIILGVK